VAEENIELGEREDEDPDVEGHAFELGAVEPSVEPSVELGAVEPSVEPSVEL
jgi:hypothetical protein